MKFTKGNLAERFLAIGQLGSVEEMRSELTNFQEELEADYSEHETLVTERDGLTSEVRRLKESNMELYLKATSKDKIVDEPETKTKREFKNLFDEKGGIK